MATKYRKPQSNSAKGVSRRQLLTSTGITALAFALTPFGGQALAQTAEGTTDATGPRAPYGLPISAEFPYEKQRMSVMGSEMAYVDEGEGKPVVFLHGNPTSSYLWRNVFPHVVAAGYRAIAPDLIGMGDSDKPDIAYNYQDHASRLHTLLDALGLQDVTLVVHDWGSALGFHYARENSDTVRALAFMEAMVPPGFPAPSMEAMGEQNAQLFTALRTEGVGEQMVLEGNMFVEQILPQFGMLQPVGDDEMAFYRAPYPTPESRLPTLQWPREVPIGGEPANVVEITNANNEWLLTSDIPKLMFYASPGILMPQPVVDFLTERMTNLETRFVGPGAHFIQEEHPDLIGQGIADWLRRLDS